MPSSKLRDDLPAHYDRVAELRRVAVTVIAGLGWSRRNTAAPAATTRHEPHATTPTPSAGPRQMTGGQRLSAEELRRQLRQSRKDHQF